MKKLIISDMTLKEAAEACELSFKEKIEIAKLLDKLNVSVIETSAAEIGSKADEVLIKTICSCVKNSVVAHPAGYTKESVDAAYELIKNASYPRLQVVVPMSTVQMEYICHKKPAQVLEMIEELAERAVSICKDVEFVAADATRSDSEFLLSALEKAIDKGVKTVTLCDSAGETTTDEFTEFLENLYEKLPKLKNVKVAISASDGLDMASSIVLSAIKMGVDEIKASSFGKKTPSLESVLKIIRIKGDKYGVCVDVSLTEFQRAARQIKWICEDKHSFSQGIITEESEAPKFNEFADYKTVSDTVVSLGYDLSEEDMQKVYEEFGRAAAKKNVSIKELDAIVASSAMQVPATYKLISYVINSGNVISSTANVLLEKDGKQISGVCIGDGPIDAAFLAVEQTLGHHYELDDFQIKSVTEGREAMGVALVKLKSDGKIYSGNGISTDIIGASIRAYINAINKIVYEQIV